MRVLMVSSGYTSRSTVKAAIAPAYGVISTLLQNDQRMGLEISHLGPPALTISMSELVLPDMTTSEKPTTPTANKK